MYTNSHQLDELRSNLYRAVAFAGGDLTHQSVILHSQALDRAINEAMRTDERNPLMEDQS